MLKLTTVYILGLRCTFNHFVHPEKYNIKPTVSPNTSMYIHAKSFLLYVHYLHERKIVYLTYNGEGRDGGKKTERR